MKKRMLITTIVMLLVLAVALTTSSLAWFSASQSTVNATGGTFTANTAGSQANIGVASSFTATQWGSTAAMEVNNALNLMPLCAISEIENSLVANYSSEKTVAAFEAESLLNGARFLTNGDNQQVFPLGETEPNKEYTSTFEDQANAAIYVKNLDTNDTTVTSLKVTLTIDSVSDNAADPNFLIVLEGSNNAATDAKNVILAQTLVTREDGYLVYNFATAEDNVLISAVQASENYHTVNGQTIANVANASKDVTFTGLEWKAGSIVTIHVYAWYEGQTLDVITQGCVTTYSLSLEAGIANS